MEFGQKLIGNVRLRDRASSIDQFPSAQATN
jgi:hypothetical protein